MRRKVQLYVAGRLVDLGDDSFILYNWTREDLSNPTSVVNSSSHQIELPGTRRNNAVFGSVFRLDRRTVLGVRYDGTQFDPTRKTPFMLYDASGAVLESGYCRLDTVNTHSLRHAYALTLYGGLGSFFYALSSKDDGTPRTLADLTYEGMDGSSVSDFTMQPRAEWVQEAWDYLADGYDDEESYFSTYWNIVNFAPAYNGLPDDFDASHALMNNDAYVNMPEGVDEDGERGWEYTYKAGLDCALVSFSNQHTEWELCDLRWYLQRPVISVKAFIAACCDSSNNGGYTVDLDASFFNDDNPAYADAWWMLSMVASEDRSSAACINNVLKASKTPMEYLVSYCKMYGLLFLWDSARHKVSIVTRATFYGAYADDVIDLTDRIDRSQQITQDPVLADSKWYQLGDGGKGEFAEQYAKDYGRGYAIQRIDTGYEFDAGTKILTDGSAFQDAAEVSESDLLYGEGSRIVSGRSWQRYFQLPRFESVTYELWSEDGESKTFTMACPQETNYWDVPGTPGLDWLPKVQLHGADNKGNDGAGVLVFFAGFKDTPAYSSGSWNVHKSYFLTNDSAAMTDLAGGPCWDLTRTGIQLVALPSFRRVSLSGRYITDSFEWGVPAVRPVPDIAYPSGRPTTIFAKWWQAYLRDRYDADTRVMMARVDLRGLAVGQELLRRFYWYDNALWTLNAIRNHPMTSWDLTECEFVKVQNKTAYTQGPGSALTQYLIITPDASSFTLNPSGDTLTLSVKSSSAWTLTQSTTTSWMSVSAASGSAGTSSLTFTATSNTTTGRRQVTITLTNLDGETLSFSLMQAQKTASSLSLSPSSITIPASGTGIEGQATRGRSCRVTADDAWAVDSTTIPAWLTVITSTVGLTLKAGANSGSERSASVKVYLTGDTSVYATLSVVQEAGEGGTGGITLLDGNGNDSATVQSSGGSLTLYVTVPDADSWTVAASDSWVTVSPVSGSGDTTLAVTIPSYSGSSDRQATVTATRNGYTSGAVFYIVQAAPAAAQDYIYITRRDDFLDNNVSVGNGQEYEGFDIKASGAWTVATSCSWIHDVWYPWSGSGNDTCWFYTDVNTGAARTGTIVATLTSTGETSTFYVYQAGDGTYTLDASFNKTTIDASSQYIYLTVQATSGLSWTIDNISSGLTLTTTSGTGTTTLTVNVAAYTGSTQRTLSLRVRNTTYGLSATPSVKQNAPAATNYLRVTPFGTIPVPNTQASTTFSLESDTAWRVTTTASNVTISPSTGSGNASVVVTYGVNQTSSTRSIPVTFITTSGTVITKSATISQSAASSATLTVSPTTVTIPGTGVMQTVSVTASDNWVSSKSDSWIVTVAPNSGQLNISAAMNSGTPRTGTVTITCGDKSVTINVTQLSTASLTVSGNAVTLNADSGSEGDVTVYASGTWDISEYTDVPVWLELDYYAHGGSDEGETLTFRAKTANTTGSDRTATIRVVLSDNTDVYEDITVTQRSQSTLYATPTAINVGNAATTGFIHVVSNTSWTITSFESGLTIASAAQSGTGTADVMFAVTANPDEEVRRMRVYFATTDSTKTAMVTVIQEAAQAAIAIDPDSALNFEAGDESSSLTATRVVTCVQAWTAASSESWLQFSPSSGAAGESVTVTFTARASMSQILTATWTVTSGSKTKSLGARCVPVIDES